MILIDNMRSDSTLKGLLKARFLGLPVEIIAKRKGKSVQYVKEAEIDRYYDGRSHLPGTVEPPSREMNREGHELQ